MRDPVEGGQEREVHPLLEILFGAGDARQAGEDAGAEAVGGGARVILRRLESRAHGVGFVFVAEQAGAHAADFLGGL